MSDLRTIFIANEWITCPTDGTLLLRATRDIISGDAYQEADFASPHRPPGTPFHDTMTCPVCGASAARPHPSGRTYEVHTQHRGWVRC